MAAFEDWGQWSLSQGGETGFDEIGGAGTLQHPASFRAPEARRRVVQPIVRRP